MNPSALLLVLTPLLSTGTDPGQQGDQQGPRPNSAANAYTDPAARKRAMEDLELLGRRHGARAWVEDELGVSVDVWSSLPGLRFDLLETTWVNLDPTGASAEDNWMVHHRLPRLVHLQAASSGYMLSEYVTDSDMGDSYASVYQRMVSDGEVAWAESPQGPFREPVAEQRARGLVGRELLLSLFPLGLDAQKRRITFLRDEESGASVYMIKLTRPINIFEMESAKEFALYVDREDGLPIQLQFRTIESEGFDYTVSLDFADWRHVPLTEQIRASLRTRLIEAWRAKRVEDWVAQQPDPEFADPPTELLEGEPAPESIMIPEELILPYRRYMGGIDAPQLTELWMEDPVLEALPPAALERPWLSGRLFGHPVRADFWDPPAPQAEAEVGGDGAGAGQDG